MNEMKKTEKVKYNTKFFKFVERNQTKILVAELAVVTAAIALRPSVQALRNYRQMLANAEEAKALLVVMYDGMKDLDANLVELSLDLQHATSKIDTLLEK